MVFLKKVKGRMLEWFSKTNNMMENYRKKACLVHVILLMSHVTKVKVKVLCLMLSGMLFLYFDGGRRERSKGESSS